MPFVAPLAGAWVEISSETAKAEIGLVAPLAGAWVEICRYNKDGICQNEVAPLAGAWVEILKTA